MTTRAANLFTIQGALPAAFTKAVVKAIYSPAGGHSFQAVDVIGVIGDAAATGLGGVVSEEVGQALDVLAAAGASAVAGVGECYCGGGGGGAVCVGGGDGDGFFAFIDGVGGGGDGERGEGGGGADAQDHVR